jgi:hypothetical protein
VPPQILQLQFLIGNELSRCRRHHDLAAMCACGNASGAVHIHADVIALMAGRLPGMQSHPYSHLGTVRPIVGGKPALSHQRSSDRICCRSEDDEEAVSLGPDLCAMTAREFFTHDGALPEEHFAVVHSG